MAGVCRLSARFVLWGGGAACLRKREVPSRIYRLLLPKKVALEPSSEYATATAATTTPTCRATTDGKNPSAYRCRSAVSPPMVLSVGVLPQWTEPAGVRTRRRERKKKSCPHGAATPSISIAILVAAPPPTQSVRCDPKVPLVAAPHPANVSLSDRSPPRRQEGARKRTRTSSGIDALCAPGIQHPSCTRIDDRGEQFVRAPPSPPSSA